MDAPVFLHNHGIRDIYLTKFHGVLLVLLWRNRYLGSVLDDSLDTVSYKIVIRVDLDMSRAILLEKILNQCLYFWIVHFCCRLLNYLEFIGSNFIFLFLKIFSYR